ncbi:Ribonuclease 7 [Myotis davidii]|uniref:Ribonuclease 7 n=1 Tax=Myotis davidii TaxID=225400 RepID=L5LC43_MYODS|nr:Ribonuclease 7 [Myotis davidii]
MAPARAGFAPCCCSCCWGCGWPRSAPSPNTVSAQWFETQNVQPSPQGCKGVTGNISKHANHCKGLHTFLHEAFSSVAATCHTPSIACKIGQESCHRSQKPVSLTTCELP